MKYYKKYLVKKRGHPGIEPRSFTWEPSDVTTVPHGIKL